MPAQKIIGGLLAHLGPDGALMLVTDGWCIVIDQEETRGLFDYLLQHARHFQASSERLVDGEPLRQQARMERQ